MEEIKRGRNIRRQGKEEKVGRRESKGVKWEKRERRK